MLVFDVATLAGIYEVRRLEEIWDLASAHCVSMSNQHRSNKFEHRDSHHVPDGLPIPCIPEPGVGGSSLVGGG